MKIEESTEILEKILDKFTDYPYNLDVSEDKMGTLFEIDADKRDRGTIIGKKGQNANAVRRIFKVIGVREKIRYNIKIIND